MWRVGAWRVGGCVEGGCVAMGAEGDGGGDGGAYGGRRGEASEEVAGDRTEMAADCWRLMDGSEER